MNYLHDHAEAITMASAILTSAVTCIAVAVAWYQIRASRNVASETAAIQAYRDYLAKCTLRPELGGWDWFRSNRHKTPQSLYDSRKADEKSESYLWFLSELLFTCELILRSNAAGSMKKALKYQIGYHFDVIQYLWSVQDWKEPYPDRVAALVEEVLSDPKKISLT